MAAGPDRVDAVVLGAAGALARRDFRVGSGIVAA
jgi:hypothetical protein